MFHLTDDDVIERPVYRHRRLCKVRIQVWQSDEGKAAVVLVSEIDGQLPPDCASSKFATFAFQHMLGFPARGMHYFELSAGKLYRVLFNMVGPSKMRAVLDRPSYEFAPTGVFDNLIGKHHFGDAIDLAA